MNAIALTGGASCSLTAYAPDTPRAGRKATRRARCSGLAPALSRLRGTYALTRSGGGLAPAESVPEDVAAHYLRSIGVPLRALRLVRESGVIDRAEDAAPSRAWPRRNSAATTSRPAGQRRITARVMRSFGRRLPHTLPFPAHPRVASRPKSPAPAVATLFGLPATLRAGTESVLFPWRCSRQGRALWVVRTSPQNATRHARAAYRP